MTMVPPTRSVVDLSTHQARLAEVYGKVLGEAGGPVDAEHAVGAFEATLNYSKEPLPQLPDGIDIRSLRDPFVTAEVLNGAFSRFLEKYVRFPWAGKISYIWKKAENEYVHYIALMLQMKSALFALSLSFETDKIEALRSVRDGLGLHHQHALAQYAPGFSDVPAGYTLAEVTRYNFVTEMTNHFPNNFVGGALGLLEEDKKGRVKLDYLEEDIPITLRAIQKQTNPFHVLGHFSDSPTLTSRVRLQSDAEAATLENDSHSPAHLNWLALSLLADATVDAPLPRSGAPLLELTASWNASSRLFTMQSNTPALAMRVNASMPLAYNPLVSQLGTGATMSASVMGPSSMVRVFVPTPVIML